MTNQQAGDHLRRVLIIDLLRALFLPVEADFRSLKLHNKQAYRLDGIYRVSWLQNIQSSKIMEVVSVEIVKV